MPPAILQLTLLVSGLCMPSCQQQHHACAQLMTVVPLSRRFSWQQQHHLLSTMMRAGSCTQGGEILGVIFPPRAEGAGESGGGHASAPHTP